MYTQQDGGPELKERIHSFLGETLSSFLNLCMCIFEFIATSRLFRTEVYTC